MKTKKDNKINQTLQQRGEIFAKRIPPPPIIINTHSRYCHYIFTHDFFLCPNIMFVMLYSRVVMRLVPPWCNVVLSGID